MKIEKYLLASFFCWQVAFATTSPESLGQHRVDTQTTRVQVRISRDVPYADSENPRQRLHLAVPIDPTVEGPLPLVVVVHGGAWRAGDRNAYLGRIQSLAETGRYAAASVGYRLTDEATWPAQIHDVKAAIRYLRANAEKLGLDPERIAVGGSSAGGHLAAMAGLAGDEPSLEGELGSHRNVSSRVQLVLDQFGPTDLLSMNDAPGIMDHNAADSPESRLVGGPIQENAAASRAASPTSYVSDDDPPVLMLHGTEDRLVPLDQSRQLEKLLKAAGVEVQLIEYPGAGHGLRGVSGVDEEELRFLDKYFYP